MRNLLSVCTICALAACGGGGGTGATTSTSSAVSTGQTPAATVPPVAARTTNPAAGASVDQAAFTSLLNNVRVANSAAPVAFDGRLATAAQGHADDMLANGYFSHTGQNGSTPGDRITAAGYRWRTYGENIARGQQSEAEVMQDWTNSSGHHANNINPAFEDFGIAKAGTGGNAHWVLVLGTER